jgi:hypothetical protein
MKTQTAIIAFIIFAILLALPAVGLQFGGHANLLVPYFWLLYAFITGLTFLVMVAIIITKQVNPENYAQTFLATTVFKLLAVLAFMVVFIMKIKVNKAVFVGDFFYLYFLNTAFEVSVLLRNLRNQNLK